MIDGSGKTCTSCLTAMFDWFNECGVLGGWDRGELLGSGEALLVSVDMLFVLLPGMAGSFLPPPVASAIFVGEMAVVFLGGVCALVYFKMVCVLCLFS